MIGDPIAHSLSPRLHAAAIESAGLSARYIAIRVAPSDLAGFVSGVHNGSLDGFNVTIPHKQTIVPYLDALDATAGDLGAVNTAVRGDHGMMGFNTDVIGFSRALKAVMPDPPGTALVLGAGGAARAAAYALRQMGTEVGICGRRPAQVAEVLQVVDGAEAVGWGSRAEVAGCCDLVVNSTPLGMARAALESPLPHWSPASGTAVAFDLIYGRETPFLREAADAGWVSVNGLEMLVQQAAEAFRLWFGIEPDLNSMRRACSFEDVSCSVS